jgi:hypothetical protein
MEIREQDFRKWAAEFEAVEAYEFSYYPSFTKPFGASLWKTHSGDLFGSMWMNAPIRPVSASMSRAEYERMRASTEIQELGDLDPIAWRVLQETPESTGFWTDKEWTLEHGRDGSDWYFAGLREGQYLFREAWSPVRGYPAYELGRFFFSLVPRDFAFVVYDEHSRERFERIAEPKGFPTIFVY